MVAYLEIDVALLLTRYLSSFLEEAVRQSDRSLLMALKKSEGASEQSSSLTSMALTEISMAKPGSDPPGEPLMKLHDQCRQPFDNVVCDTGPGV